MVILQMNTNSYLTIANNEYKYLIKHIDYEYLNPSAAQAQQVVEKYLKYLVETFCLENTVSAMNVLKSHNLSTIYTVLNECGIDLDLDRGSLALLKGYYFETRYPGEDYYIVTKDSFDESLEFVKEVRCKVYSYLTEHNICPKCGHRLLSTGTCSNINCE